MEKSGKLILIGFKLLWLTKECFKEAILVRRCAAGPIIRKMEKQKTIDTIPMEYWTTTVLRHRPYAAVYA